VVLTLRMENKIRRRLTKKTASKFDDN